MAARISCFSAAPASSRLQIGLQRCGVPHAGTGKIVPQRSRNDQGRSVTSMDGAPVALVHTVESSKTKQA
jgi:hypothetical protein